MKVFLPELFECVGPTQRLPRLPVDVTHLCAPRTGWILLPSLCQPSLRKHIEHCVVDAVESKNRADIDDKISEIISILKRSGSP